MALATVRVATTIATQAVISGAYPMSCEAIRVKMGFLPRREVCHTSKSKRGQIYVPAVNTLRESESRWHPPTLARDLARSESRTDTEGIQATECGRQIRTGTWQAGPVCHAP